MTTVRNWRPVKFKTGSGIALLGRIEGRFPSWPARKALDALTIAPAAFGRSLANVLHLTRATLNGRNEDAADVRPHQRDDGPGPAAVSSTIPEDKANLGRLLPAQSADAEEVVLSQFYDLALKKQPDLVAAYSATAELALEQTRRRPRRRDPRQGPQGRSDRPAVLSSVARPRASPISVDRAPVRQARRTRSHQDQPEPCRQPLASSADHLIDDENTRRRRSLAQGCCIEVNPKEPRALPHGPFRPHPARNDPAGEAKARDLSLGSRPLTDLGRSSLRSVASSRRSTASPRGRPHRESRSTPICSYLPAKLQLCQRLAGRLGDETEGWKLADDVLR